MDELKELCLERQKELREAYEETNDEEFSIRQNELDIVLELIGFCEE